MPTFLRSSGTARTSRMALVTALALVVVGAAVGACGSDDSSANGSTVDAGLDATMPVATSDGGSEDANDDAAPACDADISEILTQVASSGYASCALCLEKACDAPLKACYMDCACTQEAAGLFSCISSGGSPEICATALISGSNESQVLQFIGCSHICGSECVPDAGVDAATTVTADAGDDASDDAATH